MNFVPLSLSRMCSLNAQVSGDRLAQNTELVKQFKHEPVT